MKKLKKVKLFGKYAFKPEYDKGAFTGLNLSCIDNWDYIDLQFMLRPDLDRAKFFNGLLGASVVFPKAHRCLLNWYKTTDHLDSYFSSIDTLRTIEVAYSCYQDSPLHGIWVPDDSIIVDNAYALKNSIFSPDSLSGSTYKEQLARSIQRLELLDAIFQKSPEAIEAFCKCHEDELVRDVPFMVWRHYRKAS